LLAHETAHVALSRQLLGHAFNGAAEGAIHVGCAMCFLEGMVGAGDRQPRKA
jgi:hypothetical protein